MKTTSKLVAKAVGIVVAIALVLGLCVYFIPIFRVTTIKVTGNSHLTDEQIEKAADVADGTNLLRVNAHEVAKNIATLPWADSVTVARNLPSTLTVTLTEHEAVAFVDANDGPHLIDSSGREFIIDQPSADAVEITGEWEQETLSDQVEVILSIPEEIRANIARLDVVEPYVMRVYMDDGRQITWGASEDNESKSHALSTVLQMEGDNWNISNPSLVSRP